MLCADFNIWSFVEAVSVPVLAAEDMSDFFVVVVKTPTKIYHLNHF